MTRGRQKRKVVVRESTGARMLEQSRVRLLCVALFFLLCFVSIHVRLVEMMISSLRTPAHAVVEHSAADTQDPEEQDVRPADRRLGRGDIVDRNGVMLATSLMTASAFANPRELRDAEQVALKLEKAVGVPHEALLKRLRSEKSFVWIKRHLTPAEQQAVNNLGIPGVYFLPEEKRIYPYGSLFAHVVGYVGVDNKGLAGAEEYFDKRLTDEVLNADPLQLSLDARLQHALRDEMEKTVDEFRAIGAAGLVLDAKTSEILAMVSLPDFNPHRPAAVREETKFNRAAQGLYEMGSTFKSFTLAMALDSGSTTLKGGYDASHPLKYANFTISDTHPKNRWLSVPEIYAYSSNIGTARMLMDAGARRQQAFLEKLGMFQPVELELPERAQPLYPKDWKEINAITIAYGHGISVTPLHLARGITALVNGGTLAPLTLVKDANHGKAEGERVLKPETSRVMARMMRLVVTHGTATRADVPGLRVGGKTGTAEKVQAGGYNKDNKMASFIGVFPVDDPAYVVLIMVDEPKGNKASYGFATGGWVAAPAVGRVIARMASLLGMAPSYETALDDAEKYWVSTEKKSSAPAVQPARANYVRPVAY